jgi:HD-like signal output (HDOD) protein
MNSKQKILEKVRSLPAMASTATKMSKLLEDPNVNISEVVDTIKYDPGLTANVLKMADLAFTAGLLHDIGKLVLSTFVDDGFNAI